MLFFRFVVSRAPLWTFEEQLPTYLQTGALIWESQNYQAPK